MNKLLDEYRQIISDLMKEIDNLSLSNNILDRLIHIRGTNSALNGLEITSEVIKCYLDKIDTDAPDILLDVYGLLQALFVSIDSLYGLSRSVTKSKWSININNNDYLREVKYIRNDVVGHPTYRVYNHNDIGFCILEKDLVTRKKLSYIVYTVSKDKEHTEFKKVEIDKIIEAYLGEACNVLSEISKRLVVEEKIAATKLDSSLTDSAHSLFNEFRIGNDPLLQLEKIKEIYQSFFSNPEKTYNRFIWRCDLIETCIKWDDKNAKRQEIIRYLGLSQTHKLHTMSMLYDKENGVRFTKQKVQEVKTPTLMKYFYTFAALHIDELKPYLANIHDCDHPYFQTSVRNMISIAEKEGNKITIELCEWLLELSNDKKNGSKMYLIGSEMRKAMKM